MTYKENEKIKSTTLLFAITLAVVLGNILSGIILHDFSHVIEPSVELIAVSIVFYLLETEN
jgi:hypothetical protein